MDAEQTDNKGLRLLAGLPALAALVIGLIVIADLKFGKPNDLNWCRTTAQESVDRADFKTAAVCYARLLQAQPRDPDVTFCLAESLGEIGQPEGARGLMQRLTPPGSAGYTPAHVWLAREILVQPAPTAASLDKAKNHLLAALSNSPDDPTINVWCAILYALQNQWDLVPATAGKSGPLLPQLAARLTQIAKEQNNIAEINTWQNAGTER